jgi:hypothetical protein
MPPMDDPAGFLAAEADGWAPFLALAGLSDADLERPALAAHGWSGRDLMAHLTFWQEVGVGLARDLAVGEDSPTARRVSAEWDARGDAWNEQILEDWRLLPLTEVRTRFERAPADLRAALAAAPETRWWANEEHRRTLIEETIDHYVDHHDELAAVLAAAAGD